MILGFNTRPVHGAPGHDIMFLTLLRYKNVGGGRSLRRPLETLESRLAITSLELYRGICLELRVGLMATKRNIRYSRLAADEGDEYYGSEARRGDLRYDYSPKSFDQVPWKSLALAIFLLLLGCLLLVLSFFILTGHMPGERSQAYGLLGLGLLTFLPGFYETRIAYYSWRGAQGYRFSAIPTY